jgi:AraC-like DNA-binding protein
LPIDNGKIRLFLEFSTDLLTEELPQRDAETSEFCQHQCQLPITKLSSRSTFIDQVRQLILAHPGFFPDINCLVDKLNQSPRTLRRKLKQEGSSYKLLLDEMRFGLSKQYLEEKTTISLEEVSELLDL